MKRAFLFIFTTLISLLLFISCKKKEVPPLVIWTSSADIVPYIEHFNLTNQENAVVTYKVAPSKALPPLSQDKIDATPDIVISPWLRNEKTHSFFIPLNSAFSKHSIRQDAFYPSLLDSGKIAKRQYLLPISFNLPIIVFSKKLLPLIEENNNPALEKNKCIGLNDIKKIAASYNLPPAPSLSSSSTTSSLYAPSRIGFALQSNDNFLYLVSKLMNSTFCEGVAKGSPSPLSFSFDNKALTSSITYLFDWINSINAGVTYERDFVYKYLSEPDSKRVTGGRTLFTYTTSDKFFNLSKEEADLDFRYIEYNGSMNVEDSFLMLGVTRWAKNKKRAMKFIEYFFNLETQHALLEKAYSMALDNRTFGIAGGFSSIKETNLQVFPLYYKDRFPYLPSSYPFKVYEQKPFDWEEIKQRIIIPYIKDSLEYMEEKDKTPPLSSPLPPPLSIEGRYLDWKRTQY